MIVHVTARAVARIRHVIGGCWELAGDLRAIVFVLAFLYGGYILWFCDNQHGTPADMTAGLLKALEGLVLVVMLAATSRNYGNDYSRAASVLDRPRREFVCSVTGTCITVNACMFIVALSHTTTPRLLLVCIAVIYGAFCTSNTFQAREYLSGLSSATGDREAASMAYLQQTIWLSEENRPAWVGYILASWIVIGLSYLAGRIEGAKAGQLALIEGLSVGAACLHLPISVYGYFWQSRSLSHGLLREYAVAEGCHALARGHCPKFNWLFWLLLSATILAFAVTLTPLLAVGAGEQKLPSGASCVELAFPN